MYRHCDDLRASTNPEADEVCDSRDNDRDGDTDEDDAIDAITRYRDSTEIPTGTPMSRSPPAPGLVLDASDCDDTDPAISPRESRSVTVRTTTAMVWRMRPRPSMP